MKILALVTVVTVLAPIIPYRIKVMKLTFGDYALRLKCGN